MYMENKIDLTEDKPGTNVCSRCDKDFEYGNMMETLCGECD